jgi:ATP-dependent DNA helicase DinG
MADAVAIAIERGGVLLAEAGTGTGKTLAYLVPAVLSGQRVLVSTGTKNLQEQIYFKDLPALQQGLGVPFTATLMKGRSNYLCLHRWGLYREGAEQASALPTLIESSTQVLLPMIDAWAKQTTTGDRAELTDLPEELPFWKDIAADASSCLGTQCPQHGECFVTSMRQRAAESDVVVVNHHLLCADAAVRRSAYGEVVPSSPTLVIDEAHQLEDVATQYFGIAVSHFRVEDLARDAARLLAAAPFQKDDERALRAIAAMVSESRAFFDVVLSHAPPRHAAAGSEARFRYTAGSMADHAGHAGRLAGALEAFEATFTQAPAPSPADESRPARSEQVPIGLERAEAAAALARRAAEIRADLRVLTRADDPDFVYYLEVRHRGAVLRASPVDVSSIVKDAVFDRMRTTILTSATLTVEGSFAHVKSRLGIRAAEEVRVPSEFDYQRQALLYLPKRMPPPRSPRFGEAAALEVIEILKRSRGRAFVLFTSYSVLRTVQQIVEMSLSYPVLVQGRAPRSSLLDQFRSTPNAVLLATASFWQGVDVVGEALSCVVIDKLPFASPSDPVTAARIEAITAQGGDAFAQYQVPLAILALQQGLGRLIRHRTDRGVLAILDPRLRTMGYGARFLASIPSAPITHDIGAVERFFI